MKFADKLEKASLDVIESGRMTKDLALLWQGEKKPQTLSTEEFIKAIRAELKK